MLAKPLPPEVWSIILHWVTQLDNEDFYCTSYEPFRRSAQLDVSHHNLVRTVNVKLTLMSVCRLWHSLMQDALYEDIYIGRRDQVEVLNANLLKPTGRDDGTLRRSLVRRLQIPYFATSTDTRKPFLCQDTIQLCSNLQILCRPYIRLDEQDIEWYKVSETNYRPETSHFDSSAPECPPLLMLKRIDWWHNEIAPPSRGVYSLYDVLLKAPNIEYLSLLGGYPSSDWPIDLTLPALRTVCIHSMDWALLRYLSSWNLPHLSHIIVISHSRQGIFPHLWGLVGSRLSTVELNCSMGFLMEDYISPILRGCKNLETLNYYVYFTRLPPDTDLLGHTPVSTVSLHAKPNLSLLPNENINLIKQHMDFLTGPALPFLRRVVLYGRWDGTALEQVKVSLPMLRDRGCDMVYADESAVH